MIINWLHYCTDKDFSDEAHRAFADLNLNDTTEILLFPTFWFERIGK